jgi:hypothetical protein
MQSMQDLSVEVTKHLFRRLSWAYRDLTWSRHSSETICYCLGDVAQASRTAIARSSQRFRAKLTQPRYQVDTAEPAKANQLIPAISPGG